MEELLVQLERLAQAFPWESVSIDVARQPEGEITIHAWLKGTSDSNPYLPFEFGKGATITEAVDNAIRDHQNARDPNKAREQKIAELKEQLRKLEQVVFNLPPYRPNRELCERNPVLKNYRSTIQAPIDISV